MRSAQGLLASEGLRPVAHTETLGLLKDLYPRKSSSYGKKAERHLKKMVDLKLIARKGLARSTCYEIIPT